MVHPYWILCGRRAVRCDPLTPHRNHSATPTEESNSDLRLEVWRQGLHRRLNARQKIFARAHCGSGKALAQLHRQCEIRTRWSTSESRTMRAPQSIGEGWFHIRGGGPLRLYLVAQSIVARAIVVLRRCAAARVGVRLVQMVATHHEDLSFNHRAPVAPLLRILLCECPRACTLAQLSQRAAPQPCGVGECKILACATRGHTREVSSGVAAARGRSQRLLSQQRRGVSQRLLSQQRRGRSHGQLS